MPGKKKRKGTQSVHAARAARLRAASQENGRHQQGRPTLLDDPDKVDEMIAMAAVGISAADISRAMQLAPARVSDWLNQGEIEIQEGIDGKYARFHGLYYSAKISGRQTALTRLFSSADEKMVDRWLTRTDDEMQYVDRDKVAGRALTNIHVGDNQQVSLGASLAKAKATISAARPVAGALPPGLEEPGDLDELDYVDAEVREVKVTDDGVAARPLMTTNEEALQRASEEIGARTVRFGSLLANIRKNNSRLAEIENARE